MNDNVRVIQLPEYKEGVDIKVKVAPQRVKLPPAIIVFQTFAKLASTRLKASTNQVLMFFFSFAEYENYIGIDIKTLSEELDMCEKTIVVSINELTEQNIIIKTKNTRDRRRNDYFLNPLAAWKGNSLNRKIKIQRIKTDDTNSGQLLLFGRNQRQLEPEPGARGQKGERGFIGGF